MIHLPDNTKIIGKTILLFKIIKNTPAGILNNKK